MASDLKTLNCDDYHVAWICAVADLEQLPACLMLDEEHTVPPYDTHYDENVYTCGSINGHTVVIATCSQGETGNVNAGRLTQALFKTFRNIRMALLVGIGGGIPKPEISEDTRKNIHLGDVVVGWPGDGNPACVYFERGRAKENGRFELVGAMQNPDYRLTQALAKLAMDYRLKRVNFDKHLARLRGDALGSEFARPVSEHDKLFKASYSHAGGLQSNCSVCDKSKMVPRPRRKGDANLQLIYHQGRIATGNAVIRDAKLRDQISLRCGGAICVEMEAAGVDINRRCLVIRGISDYADSHKSDEWQSYAAGNAAAFARELLCRVQPRSVKDMEATVAKVPWLVPLPRPQSFVGRDEPLEQLRSFLSSKDHHWLAIHGLGGSGKTALALEFAYQTQQQRLNCAVFWVSAVDRRSFEQAYRDVGKSLNIPGTEDPKKDTKSFVKARLEDKHSGPWLMIVDNADDLDALLSPLTEEGNGGCLMDHIPKSDHGAVIFTTRTKKVAIDLAGNKLIEIDKLNKSEARELLNTRLLPGTLHQLNDATLTEVFFDTLSLHALAIVQAVAFVNKNNITLDEYITLYKTNGDVAKALLSEEFIDEGRYRSIGNAVATTWAISFLRIDKQDPLAAEYLRFMACVANDDIPASMLPPATSPVDQTKAIGTLKAYAFIIERHIEDDHNEQQSTNADIRTFDMHPLVHLATRRWLEKQNQWEAYILTTLGQFESVLPPRGNHETIRIWTSFLPHAAHTCTLIPPHRTILWPKVLFRIGCCQMTLGRYSAMEQSFRELLDYEQVALGKSHPNTLNTMGYIGLALHRQGRYAESERIQREALAFEKVIYGGRHPVTLTSMHNLALAIREQGRYVEAERLLCNLIVLYKEMGNEEHPPALASMGQLASLLDLQGRHTEAEEMIRHVLRLQQKVCGREHPITLTSMQHLAMILDKQGQYVEAEQLFRKSIELQEKVVGRDHPDTLRNMTDLASSLYYRGSYKESETLNRKVLKLRETAIGMEHPHTLESVQWLGHALHAQGHYEEASEFFKRALQSSRNVLGPDHHEAQAGACEYALTQVAELGAGPSDLQDPMLSNEVYDGLSSGFWDDFKDSEVEGSIAAGSSTPANALPRDEHEERLSVSGNSDSIDAEIMTISSSENIYIQFATEDPTPNLQNSNRRASPQPGNHLMFIGLRNQNSMPLRAPLFRQSVPGEVRNQIIAVDVADEDP
ncbi:kinesin light chain [Stagonosporopsis vannaccii]|nr:kinesin light chain [Stagonosporopsis vannaccii]